MKHHPTSYKLILWSARIISSLILAFVLTFVIAHIFGDDESGEGFRNTGEVMAFIFFPVSTIIGLMLAYKWEGIGGIVATIGILALFAIRPDLILSIFPLFLLPGALYITYWILTKYHNPLQPN